MTPPAIPLALSDVRPAWLTETLSAAGTLGDGAVASARVEPIGQGVGVRCQLARIAVAYDRPASRRAGDPRGEAADGGSADARHGEPVPLLRARGALLPRALGVGRPLDASVHASAFDVAYFLSQSLDTDVRRSCERSLLARYHAALIAGGVRGHDFARCVEDYRRAVVFCFVYPVMAGGLGDLSNERGRALAIAMAGCSGAAIADWNAEELLR